MQLFLKRPSPSQSRKNADDRKWISMPHFRDVSISSFKFCSIISTFYLQIFLGSSRKSWKFSCVRQKIYSEKRKWQKLVVLIQTHGKHFAVEPSNNLSGPQHIASPVIFASHKKFHSVDRERSWCKHLKTWNSFRFFLTIFFLYFLFFGLVNGPKPCRFYTEKV